jgi:hypothetical protein
MDTDRIQKTQKEIEAILPAREEYVVSTSEYHSMRERVFALGARRKPEQADNRPRLIKPLDGAKHGE